MHEKGGRADGAILLGDIDGKGVGVQAQEQGNKWLHCTCGELKGGCIRKGVRGWGNLLEAHWIAKHCVGGGGGQRRRMVHCTCGRLKAGCIRNGVGQLVGKHQGEGS